MNETLKTIICKLLSGRFILTLIAGGVFAYISCLGMIEPKDSMIVIMVVINSYFLKKRDI